jgi:hypothetical protein
VAHPDWHWALALQPDWWLGPQPGSLAQAWCPIQEILGRQALVVPPDWPVAHWRAFAMWRWEELAIRWPVFLPNRYFVHRATQKVVVSTLEAAWALPAWPVAQGRQA